MEKGRPPRVTHYFRKGTPGKKVLIPFSFRGIPLQFVSYTSLFSGGEVDLGTRLLLEHAKLPDSGLVLDIGCGYGVIGISIAKASPKLKVYMVDVNPLAVKVAKLNARINEVEDRVTILLGDSYEPVGGILFDAIFSNPPLSAGASVVEKIVLGAKDHLKKGGWAQFVLARGASAVLAKAREVFTVAESVSKKGYTLLYLEP